MTTTTSSVKDYTVGWICAITCEYTAAQAFLDEEHELPEYISRNDNNTYTLGKVGNHNVVIAVSPQGEYGIAAAASVARDMLHTFPNIRIGLMVGIGGGAPSQKHDIRLGDIVVSAPRNGYGGIFQYDHGKTIQNEKFQTTGFLNQPPGLLRAAMTDIEAQYERKGHRLDKTINDVLERWPNLRRKGYMRPDQSSDRLYRSDIVHPSNEVRICEEVCGGDSTKLVLRPHRNNDDANAIAIHYGLIASGDQLMKDALVRDKLLMQKDVLCFEMEAAGLMNHFPCLVIRGICDYSDSHKNKEWQGYAAMAAAAYAKDLLRRIPPSRVEAEQKISHVLALVERGMNEVHVATQITTGVIKNMSMEHREDKVRQWLSPPDPSTNHKKALHQRHGNTGLWFLRLEQFHTWKTKPNSFLWIYGIPGCGKTILSSTIIQHLDSTMSSPSLLYFYFDFNDIDKQTLESLVKSLIVQLYNKRTETRPLLDSLFTSCDEGQRQPTFESLYSLLFKMLKMAQEAWIVLDAFDEYRTWGKQSTDRVLLWIRDILNLKKSNVHLLVTSRPKQSITSEFSELRCNKSIISMRSEAIDGDINSYIHARVRHDPGLKRWKSHQDVQDEIERTLTEKSDGMFRWVACQLDALENCLDYRSLQKALASLPTTLDETYNRIMNDIPSESKHSAIRILQFLAFSERPLRIQEAIDAIAVDIEVDPHFTPKYRMPNPLEISRYCSSLVVMIPEKDEDHIEDVRNLTVQLAHFSVKEYLVSDRLPKDTAPYFQVIAANAAISKVCLAYLLQLDEKPLASGTTDIFPFAEFSARYWMIHAAVAEGNDETLRSFIKRLLNYENDAYKICYSLFRPDEQWHSGTDAQGNEPPSPLYYASFVGLTRTVDWLLSQDSSVDTPGGVLGDALQAASAAGNEQIVKQLLAAKSNINSQIGDFGNALHLASFIGHKRIVVLLLDSGADINIQGGKFGNALQAAAFGGHKHIVNLLLDNDANFDQQNGHYGNALQAASFVGHYQIITLLLDRGADVNMCGGHYNTALQAASVARHERVVKLLIDRGANINIKGGYFGHVLQAAAFGGHDFILQLLLDRGAEVDIQDGYFGNALQAACASAGSHEQIVKLLLNRVPGDQTNSRCGYFGNALQAASFRGHEQIVKILLTSGADVDLQGGHYGNALQAASFRGHTRIVRLLLDRGASINIQGGYFGNALKAASVGNHKDVKILLLEKTGSMSML